ncbi:MAG: ATP-binding cassette domain-containing protein [Anaerolineales bacterium]|jgi:ATP-binding cassette subfamily B protein
MSASTFKPEEFAWPVNRLGELLENLARRARYVARPVKLPQPPEKLAHGGSEAVGQWIDAAAGSMGLETEPLETGYADTSSFLRLAGPAILRLPGELTSNDHLLVGLVKAGRRSAIILRPDLRTRRIPIAQLRDVLCGPYESALTDNVNLMLREAGVPDERMQYARRAILKEQLSTVKIPGGWMLRISPGASMWKLFRHHRVLLPTTIVLFLYLVQQLLSLASWYVIGRGFFMGNYDLGWMLAWVILLFSTIPVAILVSDAQTELSINVGAIFKQRLLYGTVNLEPEEIRHQGMGGFLSRVMESEAVEFLAMNGGFLAVLSLIELALAVGILAAGAGGWLHASFLLVWVLITLVILFIYYRKSLVWTRAYREMTNELVENMVGHRTRLAQEDRLHWHDQEDIALDRYINLSEDMDRIGIQINAFVSRGWLIVGLLGIAIPYIAGSTTPALLAVSLGGVIYATQALGKLTGSVQSFIGLIIAWRQVGPLFQAAERPREQQSFDTIAQNLQKPAAQVQKFVRSRPDGTQPLLLGREISFRYLPTTKPVLEDCSLEIYNGDRILLEGASGGGKSTLASLLTGLRSPERGSLLLWGYDRQILGIEEWRRRVVMAPQFQENYVFSDTLGFNLLMGRGWPPRPEDLEEAEEICRELGLGEVIDRMPSGFQQMLGESGWQLSHGERSRLFIARTLLQKADLIVLDESFGALDPENLYRALQTVLQRAPALLVIAHP